jgi:hypothetical protein
MAHDELSVVVAHTEGHQSGVVPLGEIQQDVDRIAALVRGDLRQGLAFDGRIWAELGDEDAIRSASGALQRCGVAVAEALAAERVRAAARPARRVLRPVPTADSARRRCLSQSWCRD